MMGSDLFPPISMCVNVVGMPGYAFLYVWAHVWSVLVHMSACACGGHKRALVTQAAAIGGVNH